ncbi:MAG: hypothetical protein Q7T54_00450 [Candidatus Levybacteria bacterium]|nr:hypothetical protein [Candidatus Levybacteria bacterium]
MGKVIESITNYLKATLLPYLLIWVKTENFLEYKLGNLIDPPPRPKRKETRSSYFERITPRQAVRITQYEYNKMYYHNVFYHVSPPDLSIWEDESKKVLEKLVEALFMMEDEWKEHYQTALRRKMMER